MAVSADDVAALVAREMAAIVDVEVREALRAVLTIPTQHLRNWDYGAPGEQHPCWTVAADPLSNTAILYSQLGFGPSHPWGIVSTSSLWFGMDSGWFPRLEDAFVDVLGEDLPIWDVVAEGSSGDERTLATSLRMKDAFARRDELAAKDAAGRYHVVYRSRPPDS